MLHPLTRFEWERVVMQVEMPPTAKLIALALATFGNRSGANIHPGNKRLARELGLSLRTVERQVDWLRTHGLIEQTFQGRSAGRRGLANTYRLVVADDLPDLVTFAVSPDTAVGSSDAGTDDTDDGSSDGTPDTGDATSPQNTRHDDSEHPTPVTGTPDTSDGTPDTGDDPSCKHQQTKPPRSDPSSDASAVAVVSTIDADMAVIKRLPRDDQERLWNEIAQAADDDTDWPTLVHRAAERILSEAVA